MKRVLKKEKEARRKGRVAAYEEMLDQGNASSRTKLNLVLIPLGLQAI